MKTRLFGLVGVAAILFLAGCPEAPGYRYDETDNGTAIVLPTGVEFSITMESNATTGYGWFLTEVDAAVVAYVDYEYSEAGCFLRLGSGGEETYTFRAATPGSTTIRLEYRRLGEPNAGAAEVFEINVTVSDSAQ
ncbi:MAG: inhibitor of cysteine peptidase [Candidatus Hydrogenedentes bacterium]|nr:inhibitor of cysteine peptidase [Candidatus Hydrogenedentota bacterium]